jgi:hypothetical protein
MGLKNIFKMTKTDRYTQDGRAELAKLQETEDVKYKTGDISQKTGLQKQPDGSWAPPKNQGRTFQFEVGENGQAKPGTGKEVKTYRTKKEAQEALKTFNKMTGSNKSDFESVKKEYNKALEKNTGKPGRDYPILKKEDHVSLANEVKSNTMPGSDWTAEEIAKEWKLGKADAEEVKKEFDKIKESKPAEEKPERFNYRAAMEKEPRSAFNFKGTVSHSIPMNQTDYDELNGLAKFMNEEKATYQNALKSRAQALVDGHKSNGDWYPEKEQAIMKIAKAVGFDEELHKFIEEENRGYDLGYSEDAAPKIRELTGDCKIRIRPETQDVKYKTGDISQKTGLQKQPDGSWAPPKTGKTPGSKPEEQTATEAAKTSQEKPARKSLNQIMLEKKGFKRVENSTGPRANMPRYQYTSRIGKTYNVWRGPAGMDGFIYYVQTPGGFAKKMKDVDEIKRYLESDGGNWGNAPGPRGLFHGPGESRPATLKETSPDDWAWAEGVASRNNIHPMDLIKNNKALKPGVNVKFSTPKDGELEGEIIDIAGYEGKAYVQVSTKKGNKMIPTENLSVDSAPRQLTGDTRIRVKK